MLPILLALALGAPPDLSQVERTIRKEPAYGTQPKYCLLVFGPEARTRVWLALDGDTLYADLNGDGDLTAPGEKFKLPPMELTKDEWAEAMREAKLGPVREGELTHTDLTLFQARVRKDLAGKTPEEREIIRLLGSLEGDVFAVGVTIQGQKPFKQRAIVDANGVLRFAATPADAPVVHFNGPWTMGLHFAQRIALGGKPVELKTSLGTPGLGKGTFAAAVYEGLVPGDVHPVAEITFPGAAGSVKVTLDQRC